MFGSQLPLQTYLHTLDWNDLPAELLIHYKSGQRHSFQTSVSDARKRATTAINRKGVHWIRVTIPNPDNTKAVVALYDNKTKWTRKVIDLPTVKD